MNSTCFFNFFKKCGSHLWFVSYFYGMALHCSDPLYAGSKDPRGSPAECAPTLVLTHLLFWGWLQYYLPRGPL